MKKILLIVLALFLMTGCGKDEKADSKKPEEKEQVTIKEVNVFVDGKSASINVQKKEEDYTELGETIVKAIGYEISLDKSIDGKTAKVELAIPKDFDDHENLKVYYVENDAIKETFEVTVETKDEKNYAVFETTHFSLYVLAQVEEPTPEEENEVVTPSVPSTNETVNNNQNNNNNAVDNSQNSTPSEPNYAAVPQTQVPIYVSAINVPEGAVTPVFDSFTHPFRTDIGAPSEVYVTVDFSNCQIGVLCYVHYNYDDFWGEPVTMLPHPVLQITLEPIS